MTFSASSEFESRARLHSRVNFEPVRSAVIHDHNIVDIGFRFAYFVSLFIFAAYVSIPAVSETFELRFYNHHLILFEVAEKENLKLLVTLHLNFPLVSSPPTSISFSVPYHTVPMPFCTHLTPSPVPSQFYSKDAKKR